MADDKFLSQDEVDALLRGVTGDEEDDKQEVDTGEPRPYNLATQERIVRGRMPTLEIINERFARLVRVELFNFLRRTVEVSVGPVRILKYTDFIRNVIVPTNLNLVHITPFRGTAMVICDPTLVFLVVDTMFGGDGRFHTRVEGREFTHTEHRIIQRILNIVFETYEKSWAPVHPIKFEFLRSEMNTQFANIATPNEVVVAFTYTIEMGSNTGEIHFCMPYAMIEPIRDVLTSPLQGEVLGVDKRWVKLMTQQVQAAEVTIVANLAHTKMQLEEVLNMKAGDIIPLHIDESIEAKIDGVPVMQCKYGTFNGQYALRVEKLLRANSSEYVKGEPNGE
jgi:flagellar motor switch protein FliM